MEIFKTLLMGCGALVLLSMVGCVGLVGVGSYAVEQALTDENGEYFVNEDGEIQKRSTRPKAAGSTDPFSDYNGGQTYDEDGEEVGGWGDETN
ncbi:MAG: hypothetical protein ABJN35_08430 [Erythrobacter sp.]